MHVTVRCVIEAHARTRVAYNIHTIHVTNSVTLNHARNVVRSYELITAYSEVQVALNAVYQLSDL